MKIGTDIVQINRIERLYQKFGEGFKQRFLCESEILLANKTETLAGFWAAKEAIAKALGCGIGGELSFHDIVLSKDKKGAPHFHLTQRAKRIYPIVEASLSISHDGGFAIAVVAIHLSKHKESS